MGRQSNPDCSCHGVDGGRGQIFKASVEERVKFRNRPVPEAEAFGHMAIAIVQVRYRWELNNLRHPAAA